MRRISTILIVMFATVFSLATAAHALTATLGNDAIYRGNVDGYSNFTIVDTNNPAAFDGTFAEIEYYAHRAGNIRFVIVDITDTVTWVSDVVTATEAGVKTVTFDEPVGVTAGSNIGVYSELSGVVSWQYAAAAPAAWEANNAGLPSVGEMLTYEATTEGRIYSMNANIEASSPAICKDGGWEMYGYKNQGQCIASIVANENSGK